jgi:hypothetical protein
MFRMLQKALWGNRMMNKRQKRENRIIEDAVTMKALTGYNPIAVLDCINELEGIKRRVK